MDDYANKFQKLQRKTDTMGRTSVANIVQQFLIELNPVMASIVYVTASITLQVAIDMAKRYEVEFMMTLSASEFDLVSHPLALCCLTFSSRECGSLSRLYHLNLICR